MKIRAVLFASLIFVLGGCISIATHEEQMRRCRSVSQHAEELEAQVKDLENQLAEKNVGNPAAQKNYDDSKAASQELHEKLKSNISEGEVAVATPKGNLTITLRDKILFRSGEWELAPSGEKVLLQIVDVLKKSDDKLFRIEGNTDNAPVSGSLKRRFPSNWDLSSARAAAVVRYLEKSGIDPSRLVLVAYGDRKPVGDNTTADGRKLNRRVEISLEPMSAQEKK